MSGFIFLIIFFTVFILLFGLMIYTSIKNSAKVKKMYEELILKEGFRDIINSSAEKNEFIQKAMKVANKYNDYNRITPGKLVMKQEENITLYVSSANLVAGRKSSIGEAILLVTLPVNIDGTFIIRSKLPAIIETLVSGVIESKGLMPVRSDEQSEDKFVVYTSNMKNRNFLTPSIREVLENYSKITGGAVSAATMNMGTVIVITDNILYISGMNTSMYEDLHGLLKLATELSSALLKSISEEQNNILTDSMEKICPSCREKITGNNSFCTNCGGQI
jgi:hypothetical protein